MNLTKATQILLKYYNKGTICSNQEIVQYNTHKLRHSNGVLEIGRLVLMNKEFDNINKELQEKAEILFLLHDLGRFYQNNKKRILRTEEFEHGDAGYHILLQEKYDYGIALATKYHNKLDISDYKLEKKYLSSNKQEQNDIDFLIKIIRDVDKLQNLLYMTFSFESLMKIDYNKYLSGQISPEVYNSFQKGELINNQYRKTKEDYLLSMISWLFDLNYKTPLQILLSQNFTNKILEELKKSSFLSLKRIKEIKLKINRFTILKKQ